MRRLVSERNRLLRSLRHPRPAVLTDNGACYRAVVHAVACRMLGISISALAPTGRGRREGGALHPHPARRLALRRRLPHQQRTRRRPRRLARLVQPAQTTALTRPKTSPHPARRDEQRRWDQHLDHYGVELSSRPRHASSLRRQPPPRSHTRRPVRSTDTSQGRTRSRARGQRLASSTTPAPIPRRSVRRRNRSRREAADGQPTDDHPAREHCRVVDQRVHRDLPRRSVADRRSQRRLRTVDWRTRAAAEATGYGHVCTGEIHLIHQGRRTSTNPRPSAAARPAIAPAPARPVFPDIQRAPHVRGSLRPRDPRTSDSRA